MAEERTRKGRRGGSGGDGRGSARSTSASAAAGPGTLPVWVPPVLYGVLTIFLFREFVFSDAMLYGGDTVSGGYQARALYAEAIARLGRVPGWTPYLLGGTPFLEALSGGDSLYPPSLLLLLIMEPHRALGWKLVLHVFLAGLFFFGWARSTGSSRAAALLGGAAYMLGPFLIGFVHPGHDGKVFVTALAPLLFWAVERHFRAPGIATVSGIGLVVATVLYTTHFQMAYFLFGAAGLYAIWRSIQIGRGKDEVVDASVGDEGVTAGRPAVGGVRFALFLAGSLLGAAGAAYQLLPAAEYVMEYSRRTQTTDAAAGATGRAWSASYSLNPEEVMSLVIPEFAGNSAGGAAWATNTYWGRNFFKDNHAYAGLVVLLLAAVSFVGARRRQLRWFLVVLGLLALGFGLGEHTPVWGLFYTLVPGVRLFRSADMIAFLFAFSAITLATQGVDRIRDLVDADDEEGLARVRRVLWAGTGILAGLALLVTSGVFTSVWTTVVWPGINERSLQVLQAHLPNIARGASIALLLGAATAGTVWAWTRGRIPTVAALGALVALVVVDEARIDGPFIQTMDFYQWSQPDPNVRAILDREQGSEEPYRLFSMVGRGQDVMPAMYGIELAAGHHPNDLGRYRELIGMTGSEFPENLRHPNVRRILNVRYILWPDIEVGASPAGGILSRTQLADGRPYHTLMADAGLPRARLVGGAVVKRDDEAVAYITSDQHDPTREVVLPEAPPIPLDGTVPEGGVTWVERSDDRLELSVESDRPALLVVADNWFPAWRATVNGESTDVLRAYHTLRAVPVPAGSSTVTMWYESTLLRRCLLLSVVVLLGLMAGWGSGVLRERRERL